MRVCSGWWNVLNYIPNCMLLILVISSTVYVLFVHHPDTAPKEFFGSGIFSVLVWKMFQITKRFTKTLSFVFTTFSSLMVPYPTIGRHGTLRHSPLQRTPIEQVKRKTSC